MILLLDLNSVKNLMMQRILLNCSRDVWSRAVECVANLDVLISLSLFSESQEVMCKPVVSASSHPFLRITEGRHPCVPSDTYIPNDANLGSDENENGSFVILTGPNMGGKSTLMRQVGLLAVLSHVVSKLKWRSG